jgi:hypothetical protein
MAEAGSVRVRRRGEHGPRKYRLDDQIEFDRRHGLLPEGETEESWRQSYQTFLPNVEADRRRSAWLRRYWWPIAAYEHYCDRLEGILPSASLARPIPPEIDPDTPELVKAGKFNPPKRRRYAAVSVAEWAYRHRRENVPYAALEREAARSQLDENRLPPSAEDIRKVVNSELVIWELAERATADKKHD